MTYEWEVVETVLNSSIAFENVETLEEAKKAAIKSAKHASIDPTLPLRLFILDGNKVHVCEWPDTDTWKIEEVPGENMATIGMCKNCISYRPEVSKCDHPFWVNGCSVLLDQVELTGDNGNRATATVGPNFGCIHWEAA